MMRKRILNENEEIRELQRKLENIRTQKDRVLQINEMKIRLEESKKMEAKLDRMVLEKDQQDLLQDMKRSMESAKERQRALRTQQEQIELKRQTELNRRIENDKDRDDMMKRIEQETSAALAQQSEREAKIKSMREELLDFMNERRGAIVEAKKQERLENEKNRDYLSSLARREEEQIKLKKNQEADKQRIWANIANEVSRKNAEKLDMESLMNDMYFEQEECKIKQRAIAEATARKDHQLELLEQYRTQQSEKNRFHAAAKFEEAKVRKELIADFHERAQHDLLSNQKRKERMLAFHRELDLLIESKRNLFEAAQVREIEANQQNGESLKIQNELIEEEKQRIMSEYTAILEHFT
jgi:hypothetical protein